MSTLEALKMNKISENITASMYLKQHFATPGRDITIFVVLSRVLI